MIKKFKRNWCVSTMALLAMLVGGLCLSAVVVDPYEEGDGDFVFCDSFQEMLEWKDADVGKPFRAGASISEKDNAGRIGRYLFTVETVSNRKMFKELDLREKPGLWNMAILMDDAVTVTVIPLDEATPPIPPTTLPRCNGSALWSDAAFHVLSYSFQGGKNYRINFDYSNTCHMPHPDIMEDYDGIIAYVYPASTDSTIDLDVDSDNNGTIDGTNAEEAIEDIAGSCDYRGMQISVADEDTDGDGLPDFVDFDSAHQMAEIKLRIPQYVDLTKVRLRIVYSANSPLNFPNNSSSWWTSSWWTNLDNLFQNGPLRIWRSQEEFGIWITHKKMRDPNSVCGSLGSVFPYNVSYGDYVEPGIYAGEALNRLGLTATNRQISLWLEAGESSTTFGDLRVEAFLDPDGDGPIPETAMHDAVRFTAEDFDVDIDSDNSGEIEHSIYEEIIEGREYLIAPPEQPASPSFAGRYAGFFAAPAPAPAGQAPQKNPGKIIPVSELDYDQDGVPDYAEGYGAFSKINALQACGYNFIPMTIKISRPSPENMATAQIEFVYSLSKPVTENSAPATPPTTTNPTGDGTRDRPYTYILPDGHLRIWWMKPGGDFNSRNPNSIAANLPEAGNLIPTKTAFPISRLVDINDWNNKPGETERIVTLYLEAVRPSSAIGDQLIEVNYYKNGLGKKAKTQKEIYTAVRVESMTPQENTMLMLPEAQKTVTAKITPALACVPVYFEVIDPDDQSPYEWVGGDRARGQDVLPNDNFGLSSVYDYATFQSNINKRKAYTTTSDGIASISLQPVLPSTGDNYKVRASCCEPKSLLKKFDNWSDSSKNGKYHRSTIVESGTTVVWKTVYIEMDKMYKNGATIISTTPNNVSEIAVDNIADFSAQKDKVAVIFYPDGTEKEVTVKDVVGSSIKIESNEQLSIPQYSGIRMKGEDAVYEVSDRLLKSAFGDEQNIAGTDGGAFTKFTIVEGGRNLPKYAQFIDNEERFADAWLVHKENHNVIRIIPASRITNDRSGCSYYVGKYVFVASNIKGNLVNEMNKSETLVHELGHLVGPLTSAEFELGELGIGIDPNSHVDMHVDYPNIHFYDYGWTAITASFTRLTDKSFRIEGLTAAKLLVKRTKIRYRGTVDTYNYGEVSSVSYNNGVTTIMFTDTSSPMDTSHASVLEYFPGDQCVMSYNRKRGTGFAAFCEKCLIEIRKRDLYTK